MSKAKMYQVINKKVDNDLKDRYLLSNFD